ncbi:hypothetical protein BT69DRAFT_990032 [Atractiella rhizophila]|nr:hypothetical protein BT69DRAFT_990032 [Atractiella rhizophila]
MTRSNGSLIHAHGILHGSHIQTSHLIAGNVNPGVATANLNCVNGTNDQKCSQIRKMLDEQNGLGPAADVAASTDVQIMYGIQTEEQDMPSSFQHTTSTSSRTVSPAPIPLKHTFSKCFPQISSLTLSVIPLMDPPVYRSPCHTPQNHDPSTSATSFVENEKEVSPSSLAQTEPELDSAPTVHLCINASTHPDSPTSFLAPTEPPTPDGFSNKSVIGGKKPIPYIVHLPNGGCQYKFPEDADFDYRSPPPTPPSMPKPIHGPMPLRKEERVKLRRPNLVKPADVNEVYSKENMKAVTVRDFLFSEGEEKRYNPVAWRVTICGGVNEPQWIKENDLAQSIHVS